MIDLCQYILQDDKQCEQAAIKGGHYCRHHQVVHKSVAAAEAENEAQTPLPLVFPSSHASQLYNYFLLAQALNEGRMNAKTVNVMIRLLKACDASLKLAALEAAASCESNANDEQIPMSSEQAADQHDQDTEVDDAEADEEATFKIAASGEPAPARNQHPSAPAPQKPSPLEMFRYSRGKKGRRRRRR